MQTTEPKAAAAVRISTQLALRKRAELLEGLRPCFARTEPWLQAGKYLRAVMRELPELNGWSIARDAGDRRPDKTQRLLNHASWDTFAAMGVVRRFAVAGLAEAARKGRRRRGHLVIGAVDETGQEKAIPAEQVRDPVKSLATGLPPGLAFRTKGQLAIDLCAEACADGLAFDFVCGDEVYGSSTELRQFLESRGQAYVLRVASNLILTLAGGAKITCAQAVKRLARDRRRWEVRSAGQGSKGERWYARAWIAAASPRHHLLVRRHLRTGELAFHYCYVPEGQVLTKARLIWADAVYTGKLAAWAATMKMTLQIVARRNPHAFEVLPRRWVIVM